MRIGVFDIGTRATRLLVGDDENLAFRKNFGRLTRMGENFDPENNIRFEGFKETLNALREFILEGKRLRVKQYVAVGTAALRRARNQDQILEVIQDILGLKVTILEKEEEAFLSLLSACCHFQNDLQHDDTILLLDQGGGSTEISCGQMTSKGLKFFGLASLDLGTVLLKNLFLEDPTRLVGESYQRTMRYIEQEIRRHLRFPELEGHPPSRAFGMGSAITDITGVRGNRRQHGRVVTAERMQYLVDARINLYETSQMTVESLLHKADDVERLDEMERDLLVLYGLPVYQNLLKTYNLDRLTVCGYGLRYGVFLYLALPGITDKDIDLSLTNSIEIHA